MRKDLMRWGTILHGKGDPKGVKGSKRTVGERGEKKKKKKGAVCGVVNRDRRVINT